MIITPQSAVVRMLITQLIVYLSNPGTANKRRQNSDHLTSIPPHSKTRVKVVVNITGAATTPLVGARCIALLAAAAAVAEALVLGR